MSRVLLAGMVVAAGIGGALIPRAGGEPAAPPVIAEGAGVPVEPLRDPLLVRPAPPPASSGPTRDHSALAAELAAVVERPDLRLDAPNGVAVLDEDGHEVYTKEPDLPLMPASTNKLLTAAGMFLELGPSHNFVTRTVADAPISRDGTLAGDLTLVGVGDPSLVSDDYHRWIYPSRPWGSLDELADRLVARGLERVLGAVVGDGTAFTGPTIASGWKDEYLQDLNARHVTGLTVDAGLDWWIEEPPPDVKLEIHRSDAPVLEAATRLDQLLRDRGVLIGDPPEVAQVPADPEAVVVGAVRSPDLDRILAHTLQRSDNHMADMLLVGLGLTATGTGSWSEGAAALERHLHRIGIARGGLVVDDGSGLSRANRVTSRQLAAVDAELTDRFGDTWRSLMAVTGETGTLRGRLRGTIAQGRFYGKTGTLDDVRAIVGHVAGQDGERYHLAVIANELTGAERWKVYVLMDELILALAAELDGCSLVVPSPAPSPGEPYRSATSC